MRLNNSRKIVIELLFYNYYKYKLIGRPLFFVFHFMWRNYCIFELSTKNFEKSNSFKSLSTKFIPNLLLTYVQFYLFL